MISVDDARDRVLSLVPTLPVEERAPLDALGQVLAKDVPAEADIPPHDNAAMDGYAVCWQDTEGASRAHPVILQVIGNLAAGHPPETAVATGTAVRIMTGAVLPPGATAVVQFEDTDESTGAPREVVKICRAAAHWLNVRKAGEDVVSGSVVLPAGTVLRPGEAGILAALGRSTVQVVRRPRVALLSTGDELVDVDQPLAPGKIHDSNRYALAAQVRDFGGIPIDLGISRDLAADLSAKIREAQSKADLLVTSAGVSVGDFDFTKQVLAAEGQIDFWQVRMRPGKPLAVGRIGQLPHLGLPGNPVSAMLSFELFGRPAIQKMMGKTPGKRPEVMAVFHGDVANRDGRRCYYRVALSHRGGDWHASLTGPQGSGILTSMTRANGLLVLAEDVPAAREGDLVRVMVLDWPEQY